MRSFNLLLLGSIFNNVSAFVPSGCGGFIVKHKKLQQPLFSPTLPNELKYVGTHPKSVMQMNLGNVVGNIDIETILPVVIKYGTLIGFYVIIGVIFSKIQQRSMFSFGKPKKFKLQKTAITFDDVAGCEYVKPEVNDVIDYLRNPKKYDSMGAKVPSGILLHGEAGVGKTLLAKAIAGEANVPFLAFSGSEFVQLYVGLGATRIRELFKDARETAPCIIFIDEIDAIGGKRGSSINKNDEKEQTLNQLLVEMDGFSSTNNVIVIGATNRVDMLDSALLRPGRFDRKIKIASPNSKGREEILMVHAKYKPLHSNVNLTDISQQTMGMTGADLANIMNEATINAIRMNATVVTQNDIYHALEKQMMGTKLHDKEISLKYREIVAYHEAGHCAIAKLKGHDVVSKVSIIPSSNGAGGFTMIQPNGDRMDSGLLSKKYMLDHIAMLLGGRAAEELVYGNENITTGAGNDLQRAKALAEEIITDFAMDDEDDRLFGLNSERRSALLLKRIYNETITLLKTHRESLDYVAMQLIEKNELNKEEIDSIFNAMKT